MEDSTIKLLGSLTDYIKSVLKKDSQDITLQPNQATTFTTAQTLDLPPPDADNADVIVGQDAVQTLTNKTIDGDDNTIQDLALGSLKTTANTNVFIQRDGSGDAIDSSKAVPSGDVVGTSDTQTLVNKTINANSNTLSNLEHGSEVDNPTSGVHGVTGNVVGTTDTQTLTGKTIDADNNTISNLAHGAEVDNPTSGVHGVTGNVVGTSDTQVLTGKTIDADLNTITNIDDTEIKAGASIQLSKLAALTAGQATETNGSGEIVASSVTSTELGRLSGVTSGIQDQLNNKQDDLITTRGDIIYGDATGAADRLPLGSSGTVLTSDGTDASWSTPAGTGDVTAAANIADNALVRGDGGAKGIQQSGITVDDSDNLSGVGTIGSGAITSTGAVQGTSLTDGTATVSAGAVSGVTTLSMSGDLTVNTDALFVDASTGQVGIGTASPAAGRELEVSGADARVRISTSSAQNATLELENFSSSTSFLSINNANLTFLQAFDEFSLTVNNGATEALRADTSGNVGIKTSSPNAALAVRAASTSEGMELITDTNGAFKFGVHNDGGSAGTTIIFSRGGTDGMNTESMRIDASGNVGIGAPSPNTALTVRAASTFEGMELVTDTSGAFKFGVHNDGGSAGTAIIFSRGGTDGMATESMRIDGAGNVGIGAPVPGATLDVNGSLSKNSGSFKIDHPLPSMTSTHNLVHSFVEAPQADNIYRGVVTLSAGTATVNIDTVAGMTEGTFVLLNREVQCFTTNESDWGCVKGSVSGNILTIEAEDNTSNATISWMVVGERQDQHMYDTEWTDANGKVVVEPTKPVAP